MRTIISAKEVEALLREGGDIKSLPADAILTPSARDLLRELENNGARAHAAKPAAAPSGSSQIEAFFNSAEMQARKLQMCDIGRRLWARAYVDGNGGNIVLRVGDGLALCTPTLVSKGFMKPEDICLVDLEGNQLAGEQKRTSEILMHLQIMKRQPRAVASVHCHPPHATAFAVAGVEPPTCMVPEIEVFIGKVPIAPYRTPGTPEMGRLVADLSGEHNTILMANHGVVSWSHLSVEDAYFKMEILEAYCRTIVIASQLGAPLKTFSPTQLQDLLKIKQTLGIPDPRIGLKECELCNNDEWRPGVTCAVPPKPMDEAGLDQQAEALVQAITDQIMSKLPTGATP
jgi:L-fuculose-phosphate aldolase